MGTETAAKIKAALPSQVKEILGAFAVSFDRLVLLGDVNMADVAFIGHRRREGGREGG